MTKKNLHEKEKKGTKNRRLYTRVSRGDTRRRVSRRPKHKHTRHGRRQVIVVGGTDAGHAHGARRTRDAYALRTTHYALRTRPLTYCVFFQSDVKIDTIFRLDSQVLFIRSTRFSDSIRMFFCIQIDTILRLDSQGVQVRRDIVAYKDLPIGKWAGVYVSV